MVIYKENTSFRGVVYGQFSAPLLDDDITFKIRNDDIIIGTILSFIFVLVGINQIKKLLSPSDDQLIFFILLRKTATNSR